MRRCPIKRRPRPAPTLLLLLLALVTRCGSFDDYRFLYEGDFDVDEIRAGEPWIGAEQVVVGLAGQDETVALAGLTTTSFLDVPAVALAQVVEGAALTDLPERFRFDFTATDGYNLLAKRGEPALLPSWEDLQHGYLYRNPDGDLRVGWDAAHQPWGSAVSAYRLKYMNGGRIDLLAASADPEIGETP